ncbi:hypothetical protein GCM10008171_05360 [Methylopila jiangsuensis]|uniref:Uncharacterized protein n=1 Tax=Methylopila jiangsuensis TaxID=586230 RepID=A0A9W6N2Q5_9HYPH|nr:hypothetical protein [Methylopila jiangsuensis]MDR6285524.1 hypothetical protein [Methylopila jiangsuensis]GLK75282.1 hypothetical protein GCM10008171_05360 [Methylopila jiangsuensis]
MATPPKPPAPDADRPISRAAFFGWGLGFISLIALSVVGLGHSPQIRGAANLQYWVVVALVGAAVAAATWALARAEAASRAGDAARRLGVGLGALGLGLFLWEAVAIGRGLSPSPVGIATRLLGY